METIVGLLVTAAIGALVGWVASMIMNGSLLMNDHWSQLCVACTTDSGSRPYFGPKRCSMDVVDPGCEAVPPDDPAVARVDELHPDCEP